MKMCRSCACVAMCLHGPSCSLTNISGSACLNPSFSRNDTNRLPKSFLEDHNPCRASWMISGCPFCSPNAGLALTHSLSCILAFECAFLMSVTHASMSFNSIANMNMHRPFNDATTVHVQFSGASVRCPPASTQS